MEPRPPVDGDFELLPSPEPGVWMFRVARSDQHLGTASALAAGTLYKNASALMQRPRVDVWGDYVADQVTQAAPGVVWQYFVRALPSYPSIAEGLHNPLWGRTWTHKYHDLIANSRPDRAEAVSTTTGTVYLELIAGGTLTLIGGTALQLIQQRLVLDMQETDLGQGLCEVELVTVASDRVIIVENPVDLETGALQTVTQTHILSATKPTGAAVNAYGRYTDVKRVEHNHWLTEDKPSTSFPIGEANALVSYGTENYPWPAVLQSNITWTSRGPSNSGPIVLFPIYTSGNETVVAKMLQSYTLRKPYHGESIAKYEEWWQLTAPAVPAPTQMIAAAVYVKGVYNVIDLQECLHPSFTYLEDNLAGSDTNYQKFSLQWTVRATNMEDWASYVQQITFGREGGGYRIKRTTIYSPSSVTANSGGMDTVFTRIKTS